MTEAPPPAPLDEAPPPEAPPSEAEPASRRWQTSALWLALLGIAVVETVGHFVVQARVVPDEDWAAAAEVVRAGWQEGDLVVVAPTWADPLLRRELGDVIGLGDAGRSDLARYDRLWALSIRGHRPDEAPDGPADFEETRGRITILRWDLPDGGVLYDFTEHVEEARVSMFRGEEATPCPWAVDPRPRGGGLGAGPITPRGRHRCDPGRPWLWVGATIQDDMSLAPRHCVWQHPAGSDPIRATFPDVPLGDRLVLYADIYYEHQRMEEHGPVMVSVRIDGREVGRLTHHDLDGWKRMVVYTDGLGDRADVSIDTFAPDPHLRTICWSATTREGRE